MTGQNTSSAVMQQRQKTTDKLDYYPTPPWAGRALCARLEELGLKRKENVTCWEPAAGSGDLARGLSGYFSGMLCSDVHAYPRIAAGQRAPLLGDFLIDALWHEDDGPTRADWIITNPPFVLALPFVKAALKRADEGVAIFVRTSFLEGGTRLRYLFRPHPPALILQHSERLPLFQGKLREPGSTYWDPRVNNGEGGWKKASTATSYCWIVWLPGDTSCRLDWIEPCRKRFEREGDYPPPDQPPREPDLQNGAPHE